MDGCGVAMFRNESLSPGSKPTSIWHHSYFNLSRTMILMESWTTSSAPFRRVPSGQCEYPDERSSFLNDDSVMDWRQDARSEGVSGVRCRQGWFDSPASRRGDQRVTVCDGRCQSAANDTPDARMVMITIMWFAAIILMSRD
jgi:hypothetical protein